MNTCLAVETSVRRAPPLLGMTVILSVLLLSIGCFLPKRQGSQWPVMELASEEVQRGGYMTTSPSFRTIVNQTLINHPKRFKRRSRGVYTAKG